MWTRLSRILKHRWQSDDAAQRAIPPALLETLAAQVAQSEAGHSGEIRIYVETGLPLSYLWQPTSMVQITRERALALFGKLRVWDTERNNGVLIYVLLAERAIHVVADRGMNTHVESWTSVISPMQRAFAQGDFESGLLQAVDAVSEVMALHFPVALTTSGPARPDAMPDAPVLL